jgi:hypothetical protein
MVLFADDSTVVVTAENLNTYESNINRTLRLVIEWLSKNNLKINLSKTKIMNFAQRINKFPTLTVTYNGKDIDETNITRFLGLNLDSKLTWINQTESVCTKLNKFSYALYNLRKVVNTSTVFMAYHAYVTSTLKYGIMFWGNSTKRELVFRGQKKCIRAVCGIQPTESCKPLFIKYHILTFPCLYIYEVALYVKTNRNQFRSFKSARQQGKIETIPRKTALLRKSVFGMAPRIFNNLPKAILQIEDVIKFKNQLHRYLTKKAYYSIKEYLVDMHDNT